MNLLRRLRRDRPRSRMAWLALWVLLLQQLALVAYACPIAETPAPPQAMAGCGAMEMPDPDTPALCDQHCLRGHVAAPDLKAPQVPALALPPVQFALTEAMLPPVRAQSYLDVPVCRSDPPPAQRFCSLQI
ncbi:hypothetical protein [Marilutibacter maris]|nr:hypothetical protein [Lysobacter maris]